MALIGSRNVLGIAGVAVFSLTALTAHAQVKTFKVTGGGEAPDGVSVLGEVAAHCATGNATLLGKYTGDGLFDPEPIGPEDFDPVTNSFNGVFQGVFEFKAANGDILACTYGNQENGADDVGRTVISFVSEDHVVAVFTAEFNPVPELCTGQFAKVVDGSFTMVAVSEPFLFAVNEEGSGPAFDYTWEGEGWLEFAKGPR